MTRRGRHLLLAALLLCPCPPVAADGQPLPAFSATLDAQWNYADPAESERRFRALLAQWPAGDPQALVIATQIARSQGLRRQFAAAQATLAEVEASLGGAPSHVRIRYLLERGRVFNSAGSPDRAVPLFVDALSLARCSGDEFYAIDAAHMLGIAAPEAVRLDWNLEAVAMSARARDPRAQRWLAPLYNNIGQTFLEQGSYASALAWLRKAEDAYRERGDPGSVRIARWMVARAQRSLGELDVAESSQRALAAEFEQLGEPDGYVFEELAEIALARGDAAAARRWATRAHASLKDNPDLRANESARLDRLARIAAGAKVTAP